MARVKGTYRNQTLQLNGPLDLAEGAEVEIEVHPLTSEEAEREGWSVLGMSRLETEWDNPADAAYNDWRKLYGVERGDVVLVPFPYRDRLAEQTRPAVVVSGQAFNQNGDLVVAAVTSHAPRTAMDHGLVDWKAAGLQFPSTVRMLLATMASTRVLLQVGRLSDHDWGEVQTRIGQVFTWP